MANIVYEFTTNFQTNLRLGASADDVIHSVSLLKVIDRNSSWMAALDTLIVLSFLR